MRQPSQVQMIKKKFYKHLEKQVGMKIVVHLNQLKKGRRLTPKWALADLRNRLRLKDTASVEGYSFTFITSLAEKYVIQLYLQLLKFEKS